ncbi:hypothetical protein [Virgibacillus sp. DJP39]|uniref:hypothetical protein n=1 Tax=Virgibacillus sp. DJP39 TaxID=3409790 RepID=UPI003BB6C692
MRRKVFEERLDKYFNDINFQKEINECIKSKISNGYKNEGEVLIMIFEEATGSGLTDDEKHTIIHYILPTMNQGWLNKLI